MHALSKKWSWFHEGAPGHRFQDHYHRNRRAKGSYRGLKRALRWIGAGAALAIGVVLTVIPGPAIPFYLIAGGLLATDWLWMAKVLDWLEVRIRKLGVRLAKFWKRLSHPTRVALLLLGACVSAATTYGVYRLIS